MCFIILIRSILIILLISIVVVNCIRCDNCIHFNFCKEYQFKLDKVGVPEDNMLYCNITANIVCCPEEKIIEKTIADSQCSKFTEIQGVCEKNPLVKNGKEPPPNSLPFMVLVQYTEVYNNTKNVYQHCGGVLIDPMYVLTAAHCIKDTKMSVLLGAHNRTSGTEFDVTPIIHPNYTSTDPYADIALLRLDKEVNITTKFIKPACLTSTDGTENEYFIAGWGFVSSNTLPDTLLTGSVVETDGSKCIQKDLVFNPKKEICAGPQTTYGDVCNGDSGGPLFADYSRRGTCLAGVVGIVAMGGYCNGLGSRSRYTRVSYYREWIESEVWPDTVQT